MSLKLSFCCLYDYYIDLNGKNHVTPTADTYCLHLTFRALARIWDSNGCNLFSDVDYNHFFP